MVPSSRAIRALLLCALVVACERSTVGPDVPSANDVAGAVPPQPPTFTATATTSQVVLTWADGPDETSYHLQRGLAPDANPPADWVLLPDQAANATTYTDMGVAATTRYLYRVRGCNAEGCSGFRYLYITTNAPPPPPPPQPSTLSATATTTQVVLTWTDGADETSYKLERGLAPDANPVETWVNLPDQAANATTYTDLGVAASTRYLYRIRACNAGGCSGYRYLYVTTNAPPGPPPPQPSSLSASATQSQVVLTWTDGPDETSYKLERGLAPDANPVETWVNLPDQAANAISYTDTGVAASTRYLYRIRACNAGGCSGYRYLYVTTSALPPLPPQPSTLTATATASQVVLTWTDGPDETSYKIERGVAPDANPPAAWVDLPDQAANATTYTDLGLAASTRYLYRIRACNGAGCSGYRYLYVTTDAPPPPPPPQPSTLTATATAAQVVLTWTDGPDETSYKLERGVAPDANPPAAWVDLPDQTANAITYTDTGVAASTRYLYRIRACNGGGCSGYRYLYVTTPGSSPDLVIDALTAPAAGTTGGVIAVSMTVRNQGAATSSAFRVGFYYSTDATITTADVYSGSVCTYATGLAGVPDVCSGDIAVPASLAPGVYYVGAIADDQGVLAETDESNNTRAASSTTTLSSAPDFVITSFTAAGAGAQGGVIAFSMGISNQGAPTTTPFEVGFYYSTDATITTGDIFSGWICNYPTGMGDGSASCSGNLSVPNDLPAGTYYVGAIADHEAQVAETNEGNNTRAATNTTTISSSLPDFLIDAMTAPAAGVSGGTIAVSMTIRNQGGATTSPFRVGFYYSTDATITTADVFSGAACNYPSGLVGPTDICGGSIPVPGTLPPGTYYVGAIADDQAVVAEGSEANNTRAAANQTTISGGAPDLIVTAMTAPTVAVPGSTISISMTFRNQGAGTTTPFRVALYYSTDATITTSDIYAMAYCDRQPGLAANTSASCSGPIGVPTSLPSGTYYVGALADDQGFVAESDETNNGRAASNTTVVIRTDLVVDAMTAPAAGTAGGVIPISMTVRNQGADASGAFRVAFYYSADATITTADFYSGHECNYLGGLPGNTSNVCSGDIGVPSALATGTYYVGAIADDQAAVIEGNETNNTRAASNTTSVSGGSPTNLVIDGMYLTQAIQTYGRTVPLVANRDAYVRVFVKASNPNALAPSVRVRSYQNGTLMDTRTINASGSGVPQVVSEGVLASSWNVLLPGSLIQPGFSVLVDVDPTGAIAESVETDNNYPESGTPLSLTVNAMPVFNVTFVPIQHPLHGNAVGNVTAGNSASYLVDALKVFPMQATSTDVHATVVTGAGSLTVGSSWNQILSDLEALRVGEGSNRFYYGVVPSVAGGAWCGLGYVPGRAAIGADGGCGGATAAHEWGHNFGRLHAPCGGPANPDPGYPYANASIGHYGLDPATASLKNPASYVDLMSYCGPAWVSDYTYNAVMNYRIGAQAAPLLVESERPSLLVWGRVDNDELILEPAFELTTRPVLPTEAGPYRLEGRSADGTVLFSLSFAGQEVADGRAGDRHFAFAVPVSWGPDQELAEVRFSGPQGQVVRRAGAARLDTGADVAVTEARDASNRPILRWDTGAYPMAVARDAATGEILSFARDGELLLPSGSQAVDVVVSDGVRSASRRVTVPR